MITNQYEPGKDEGVGEPTASGVCRSLSEGFARVGAILWIGGFVIGPDRASHESPFGFGDDAVVGLATVSQTAGELVAGGVTLLERGNRYAAAALIRQLVEVESLAWTFAENHAVAADWLRSTREERLASWAPARLRERASGRFDAADYWSRCELGGHPTPSRTALLPDHARGIGLSAVWLELTTHGVGGWRHLLNALSSAGWQDALGEGLIEPVEAAIRAWEQDSEQGHPRPEFGEQT